MNTNPTPGGGLTITGDPELERGLASVQGQLNGAQSAEEQLTPTAAHWSQYWDINQIPPSLFPAPLRGPGTPGHGVLQQGAAPGSGGKRGGDLRPDFFPSDVARDKRFEGANKERELNRSRLQALADAILGRTASPSEVGEVWVWAINQIDAAEKIGAEPQDPWHWLEQRKATEEAERAKQEGPQTITQTQRSINLTDPTTVRAAIDATLRNLLGRRARDDERAEFFSGFRALEEANPTVSTTTSTTTPSADGMDSTVESSTTTTGGAPDPGTAAQSFADEQLLGEQKAMLAGSYYDILRGL